MAPLINTEEVSTRYREKSVDVESRRLLVTNFLGSEQEPDLSEPANCNGFGRIRHFRRATSPGWPSNPLPIDPACLALGLPFADSLRAQAFQLASCNWRCWYCFVPFDLLAASAKHSGWLTSGDLVDYYLAQDNPPQCIDLTGGQPDLVPEWVPWMMDELVARDLQRNVFLWSDDNLSNDYFWRFLSDEQIEQVVTFKNYARVGCFKGFDAESFVFNTRAAPEQFDYQFELMKRLLETGLDTYAYATFTCARRDGIDDGMKVFVERLQGIDELLPLRTVPLEIRVFTPVGPRLREAENEALINQEAAIDAWRRELDDRFSSAERAQPVTSVKLARGRS